MKKLGTNKLGIRFGDNDFYYTCTAFMKMLLPDDFTHHLAGDVKFTKAQIVELFNNMASSLYLLKQNAWRYELAPNIDAYLKITEDHVYLDDEVDKFTAENSNYNGEFFAVDFTSARIWAL